MSKIGLGAVLVTAFGLVGCEAPSSNASEDAPPVYAAVTAVAQPDLVTVTDVAPVAPAPAAPAATPAIGVGAAPATVVGTNAPAPENAPALEAPADAPAPPPQLSSALQEVVKLAESGVDDEVILAYIRNSPVPFNPTPEEIVYLTDIGLSDVVITALVNHRREGAQVAQAQTNAPAALPPAEVASAPGVQVVPGAQPSATYNPEPQVVYSSPPVVEYVTPPPTIEYNTFYSSLNPYGSWVEVADYGWCWQPTVVRFNRGWRPYCDRGRWTYTDCGWYWQSDYSWGWAPFHYGRWFNHPHRGWCWRPDAVWAPAWVSWRYTDSYCGWAPLPPGAHYRQGIGLTYYGAHVGLGFSFGLHQDAWTFVSARHFHDREVWRHRVAPREHRAVFGRSTVINNYVVQNNTIINKGVGPERVPGIGRYEPRKVAFRDTPERGVNNLRPIHSTDQRSEVVAYRPRSIETTRQTQRTLEAEVARPIRSTRDPRTGLGVTSPVATPRPGSSPGVYNNRPRTEPAPANVGGGRSARPIAPATAVPSNERPTPSATVPSRGVEQRPVISPAATPRPSSPAPQSTPIRRQEPTKPAYSTPGGRPSRSGASSPSGSSWTQPATGSGSVVVNPQPINPSPTVRQEPSKPASSYSPGRLSVTTPAPTYQAPAVDPTPSFQSRPARSFAVPSQPRTVPSYNSPAIQSRPVPSYSAPAIQSRPAPSYSAPAIQSRPARSYSAPAIQSRPAPSYSAPAIQQRPAPSYSAPAIQSRPARSYSAPAVQSRPAPSYSAPAVQSRPAPSAPARSSGGQSERPGRR